jgi:hypothetical protein
MSDEESSLRVRTGELTIELSGEAEALRQAYQALAPIVRERVQKEAARMSAGEVEGSEGEAAGENREEGTSGKTGTKPMYRAQDGDAASDRPAPSSAAAESAEVQAHGPAERHCRLHMHQQGFREVYMVDGAHLEGAGLGVLAPEALGVLHVSASASSKVASLLPKAETLWREIDD